MTQEWKQVRLFEVCDFQNGFAFKNSDYVEEGDGAFEIFRMGNILRGGGFNPDGRKALVSHEQARKLGRFLLKKGDILMCMTDMKSSMALLGHTARMPVSGRYLVNQRVGRITVKNPEILDQHFFYYYSNSPRYIDWLRSHANSGVQVNLSTEAIQNSPIPLPPLPVQQRIAGILSAYDELIENSQRRIRILEAMARAVYREWFVHFRFPGHENHPRVASTLGDIPQGWEVKTVPECVDINPRVVVLREGEKPFVPMGCLSNDSMLISNIESRAGNSGAKFQNGDTLFARITPCLENGKTGFVQFLPDVKSVASGSTEYIVLRSRTLTPEFVYLLARSDEFRGNAIKSMSGASGRQRVQEKCFNDFQITQPPRALLNRFSAIVAPSFRHIYKLHLQIQNLRRTRDLLLPRLLSGQVVPNSEGTES
jgi:type I restriction enzyme S subunit